MFKRNLKPSTHRFSQQGAVQIMLGRVNDFVKGGLHHGSNRFGTIEHAVEDDESSGSSQDSRDVADSGGESPGQNGHSSIMAERVVSPAQVKTTLDRRRGGGGAMFALYALPSNALSDIQLAHIFGFSFSRLPQLVQISVQGEHFMCNNASRSSFSEQ